MHSFIYWSLLLIFKWSLLFGKYIISTLYRKSVQVQNFLSWQMSFNCLHIAYTLLQINAATKWYYCISKILVRYETWSSIRWKKSMQGRKRQHTSIYIKSCKHTNDCSNAIGWWIMMEFVQRLVSHMARIFYTIHAVNPKTIYYLLGAFLEYTVVLT